MLKINQKAKESICSAFAMGLDSSYLTSAKGDLQETILHVGFFIISKNEYPIALRYPFAQSVTNLVFFGRCLVFSYINSVKSSSFNGKFK